MYPYPQMPPVPQQPYPQKKKNLKWWHILLIVLGIFLVLGLIANIFGSDSGSGDSSNASNDNSQTPDSGDTYLSNSEVDQMYTDPKSFKGKKVILYGKIFTDPEKDDTAVYFQMYADPDNNERNTVIGYNDPQADLHSGDYVKITGTVSGEFKGSNAFGASLTAPKITADSVEVVDYITAVRPTIKSVDINQTIDQFGYKCTLQKVEFAEKETRLYISFENAGKENFNLYQFSAKIVQNGTQFDTENNYYADYPSLQTQILPGVTSQGIITFEKMEPSSFQFYLDGSSGDYREDIEEYVFDVEIA